MLSYNVGRGNNSKIAMIIKGPSSTWVSPYLLRLPTLPPYSPCHSCPPFSCFEIGGGGGVTSGNRNGNGPAPAQKALDGPRAADLKTAGQSVDASKDVRNNPDVQRNTLVYNPIPSIQHQDLDQEKIENLTTYDAPYRTISSLTSFRCRIASVTN